MEKSKKWELNKADWKAALRSALVFLAPVVVIYLQGVGAVMFMKGHIPVLTDFVPNTITVGAIIAWFYMQILGIFLRYQSGK